MGLAKQIFWNRAYHKGQQHVRSSKVTERRESIPQQYIQANRKQRPRRKGARTSAWHGRSCGRSHRAQLLRQARARAHPTHQKPHKRNPQPKLFSASHTTCSATRLKALALPAPAGAPPRAPGHGPQPSRSPRPPRGTPPPFSAPASAPAGARSAVRIRTTRRWFRPRRPRGPSSAPCTDHRRGPLSRQRELPPPPQCRFRHARSLRRRMQRVDH